MMKLQFIHPTNYSEITIEKDEDGFVRLTVIERSAVDPSDDTRSATYSLLGSQAKLLIEALRFFANNA